MRIDQALSLYDQRQYDAAAQELRLSLALAPKDGFAHAMLALCLCMKRDWTRALEHAWQAVELAPSLGISFYALARALAGQIHYLDVPLLGRRWHEPTQVAQVRAAVQKAIDLNPGNPDFFALKAELEIQFARWAEALAAAEEGLILDPQHSECASQRAAALLHLGRRAEALGSLHRAVAHTPQPDVVLWIKGWRELTAGRTDAAIGTFLEGLRTEPHSEWLQLGLIEALKTKRRLSCCLVGWKLRAALWRGRPRWGRTLAGGSGLIYVLSFLILSSVLRGRHGYESVVIRAILAFSATCGVGVLAVLWIPLADFLAIEWLRLRGAHHRVVAPPDGPPRSGG